MELIFRAAGVILGTLRAEYRQIANRYFGRVEYLPGNARAICRQVISKLWEGDFYRTSLGHFDFFWMRDFGTVTQSLIRLGYAERVHHTIQFALRHYRRAGVVTLCIDSVGNCFNAPGKSIDALPWLIHSIHVSHYPLNKSDVIFLNRILRRYCKTYLHKNGDIRSANFAEMRDAVMYDRSAYATTLVARLAYCARRLNLEFPYHEDQYRELLISHYWNGHYFNADYSNSAFSAECALFPFYLGIVKDEVMINQTFDYINKQRLNEPYPLIYTNTPQKFRYHWWMVAPWMPNYQGNTIWSWHGEYYLHLLKRYKRPEYEREYKKFSSMLELHGNFPEMVNLDGSWYTSPIYKGDPGMIWAALFLEL